MRTRLNFLAAGVENPACFDTLLDIQKIKKINVRSELQCAELMSIVTYAKNKGTTDRWLRMLEARIKSYKSGSKWSGYISLAKRVGQLAIEGRWKK
jgi:hypothetical protein